MRVALVTMPFGGAARPSLALGLLKAGLQRVGIDCEAKYFNLTAWKLLGPRRYAQMASKVATTVMAGEWVFSQIFWGEEVSNWERYEAEVLDDPLWGLSSALRPVVRETLELAPMFLRIAFESNDWSRYDLVGFTSTFEQTMASLCLARMIRAAHPQVRIALGGANFEGPMGRPYLERFEFVDYVATAEADRSFPLLCQRLSAARAAGEDDASIEIPAGILARQPRAGASLRVRGQDPAPELIEALDELPVPNFDEYFEVAANITHGLPRTLGGPTEPWLSAETARGCWWGRKHHCTFCGLNGEAMSFRRKSASRVLDELAQLEQRHGRRSIQFTDNILSHDFFADLIPRWAEEDEPVHKFFEVKANLRRAQVELLARAGVRGIQPGIESLDDATLTEMAKGVSAAQNIALLRWCAELDVDVFWSILYGFPHEPSSSYARQLELLPKLTHLQPPVGCSLIRLDRFSPNFNEWRARGFSRIDVLEAYRHVFPFENATLRELAYFFCYDHPGLETAVKGGREFIAFLRRWQEARAGGAELRLAVELGEEGAELVDTRLDHPPSRRRLELVELAALLGCDRPRKREHLRKHAAGIGVGEGVVDATIERLAREHVIVELGGSFVCLALLPPAARLQALALTPETLIRFERAP
ncbi:MAG: RiPP maturation radical SAM C-methyltransferase [Myxococcota bacterium]